MNKNWKKELFIILGILILGIIVFFWIGDAWRIPEKKIIQVELILENGNHFLYSQKDEIAILLKEARMQDFKIYIPWLYKCKPEKVIFKFSLNNGKNITLNYNMISYYDLMNDLEKLQKNK